jgi:2-keto-4-pentenoate hydratase/2-oxohepta-3-ene-1,7-dioic acid hydratase in catechol pathway
LQFIRYRYGDRAVWGRIEGEDLVELTAAPWSQTAQTKRRLAFDSDISLLPPCEPTKIVCVGKNYHDHIRELHPGEDRPEEPLLFLKPPSALLPPEGVILLPPQSERVDYEGELAVVIGRKLSWASTAEVERGIFGYTLANDVTARDLQKKDGQWTRGKGFDTFCPVGPNLCITLVKDAILTTTVNGEERQRASLKQMIFSIPEIVGYISRCMTLLPGDLILTGTPEGVGPLKPGDEIEIEMPGIGILRNTVASRSL